MNAHRFAMPTRTDGERAFLTCLDAVARDSSTTNVERLMAFPAWAPRQAIARFIAQVALFQEHIVHVHGAIIEGGVAFGAGVGAWHHLSAIFEPYDHVRRIVAFDTFSGFPGMGPEEHGAKSGLAYTGGMAAPVDEELRALMALHDSNRPIAHIPRVEIVKGDACETIPQYVKDNPHLLCAALVLDFDIAAPTRAALEHFVPLIPKGGVVIFDELFCADWPGETVAVRESGLLDRGRLQRFPFTSTLSYLVIE